MAYDLAFEGSGADVSQTLELLLSKVEGIEDRLGAIETSPARELAGPLELALAGLTDDMVSGLVSRISALAEVVLDPGVIALLGRLSRPDVQAGLERLTDPSTLETLDGLTSVAAMAQAGLTDDMVAGLVRKAATLAELILDPFVLDALERAARALKAGQAEYPDVKVPPVGGAFGALRTANDPDTRRVAAFALSVMRNLGSQFA